MADPRKVVIDGEEFEFDPDLTVLQACEEAGREIPRFCYHERLSIAGNCRMCLVEAVGAPKPMASCAMQVKDLRGGRDGEPPEIRTNSQLVKTAREGVMEFLLINHPLDCPICDQAGECDLQDQAMAYGKSGTRYIEHKRAMAEINLGPLIKTHMTRCIQCTRCVRFATEVAGVPEMGCTGRGEDAEIVSYLDAALVSELQGNVIDLCPVGALTSRPYAFRARPWEVRKTQSIDVSDALGANIRIDSEGVDVRRVMPLNNDAVNEEWISDKARFSIDGLQRQRLDRPYVRGENGKLAPASWEEAFAAIRSRLDGVDGSKVGAIAGDLVSVEAIWALKGFMGQIGSPNMDCRQDGAHLPVGNRAAWLFNPTVQGIEEADAILLIGTNPRMESAVLNARIRKAWLGGTDVALIGPGADLTYDYAHLGEDASALSSVMDGDFAETLRNAERPMIVLGGAALTHPDASAIMGEAMALADSVGAISDGWTGFGVLHSAASRVGGMEIGFVPQDDGKDTAAMLDGGMDVLYLLGADEVVVPEGPFVIYQGHHGDRGAHRADVILPAAAWAEQSGLYVNLEGRPQLANRAASPPGEAKEDWAILRALSERMGEPLPFDTIEHVRKAIFEAVPHLARLGTVEAAEWHAEQGGSIGSAAFEPVIGDFYFTNPIARASETMAACSKLQEERSGVALAAE